jgi:hypothetical protein
VILLRDKTYKRYLVDPHHRGGWFLALVLPSLQKWEKYISILYYAVSGIS